MLLIRHVIFQVSFVIFNKMRFIKDTLFRKNFSLYSLCRKFDMLMLFSWLLFSMLLLYWKGGESGAEFICD